MTRRRGVLANLGPLGPCWKKTWVVGVVQALMMLTGSYQASVITKLVTPPCEAVVDLLSSVEVHQDKLRQELLHILPSLLVAW